MTERRNPSCGCAVSHENGGADGAFQVKREACPLGNFPEGTRLRVHGLRGCGRVTSRLYSMGFTPGTVIVVCGSGGGGAIRVLVRGTRVALDPCAAERVVCVPVPQGG